MYGSVDDRKGTGRLGVIIKLPKKGDLMMCSNNHGITLLSIAGKVFCTLVLLRIRDAADKRLRENQGGFRKGRSCTDQCFALRQLVEKFVEFNSLSRSTLLTLKLRSTEFTENPSGKYLRPYGPPEKIVNIMKNTYDSKCCVKMDGETTEWFAVTAGVGQSCIWSPLLFSILIDRVLKNALDKNDTGIVNCIY